MPALNDLQQSIVQLVATEKAYEVANVCVRYGLAPQGDGEDPYHSRRLYVEPRVRDLPQQQLIEIGRRLVADYQDVPSFRAPVHHLREAVRIAQAGGFIRVSEITRRKLMRALDPLGGDLSGNEHLIDFLERLWPLSDMPFSNNYAHRTMADAVWQHAVRNPEDWTCEELF